MTKARSLRREDSRALCLWAWTYDPSDIPKVTWLTLTEGSTALLDGHAPPRGRKGLTFRVLVHLDIIEPPPDEYGNVTPRKMDWRYGVVDGERSTRDRRDPPPPDSRRDRRRDDDDDDSGRRRRGDKGGWKSRMFRSLSRAPTLDRERDRSVSRHGLRKDNASSAGRRRRPTAAPSTSLYTTGATGAPADVSPCPRTGNESGGGPAEVSAAVLAACGRGRSRERSCPRRSRRVQRSPARSSPTPVGPAPALRRDSRCLPAGILGGVNRSPSPPAAPCLCILQSDASPDPPALCKKSPPPGRDVETTATVAELHASAGLRRVPTGDASVSRWTTRGRFKLGVFYRRRAGGQVDAAAPAPTPPERFKPGRVFRRRPRGPGGASLRRGCSSPTAPAPSSGGGAARAFLSSISRQVPPAILQRPSREVSQRRALASHTLLRRRSARIATRTGGKAQEYARKALMNRLGLKEEGDENDRFLRYVSLFQGPLNDSTIMAISALSGLVGTSALESVDE